MRLGNSVSCCEKVVVIPICCPSDGLCRCKIWGRGSRLGVRSNRDGLLQACEQKLRRLVIAIGFESIRNQAWTKQEM